MVVLVNLYDKWQIRLIHRIQMSLFYLYVVLQVSDRHSQRLRGYRNINRALNMKLWFYFFFFEKKLEKFEIFFRNFQKSKIFQTKKFFQVFFVQFHCLIISWEGKSTVHKRRSVIADIVTKYIMCVLSFALYCCDLFLFP